MVPRLANLDQDKLTGVEQDELTDVLGGLFA